MRFIRSLRKPEYIFRPSQIIRRFRHEFRTAKKIEEVMLPWGLPILIHPTETIGSCLWRTGVHDLSATECLWRLLDPGETAMDVGANIGYMTGLLARRAGLQGRVVALEPHPAIFTELQHNVSRWGLLADLAKIDVFEQAASEHSGRAVLHMPSMFTRNRGIASLGYSSGANGQCCEVELTTLDHLTDAGSKVGVLKLDVEGHEFEALSGATRLLKTKAIRDIVFEEHGKPPTSVTKRLEQLGYEVFFLDAMFWGPRIVSSNSAYHRNNPHEHNCLATTDACRARKRLARIGWQIFKLRQNTAAV